MGNGCSKPKNLADKQAGIILPIGGGSTQMTNLGVGLPQEDTQQGVVEALPNDQDDDEDDESTESTEVDEQKEHANTQARLKEWFRCFAEETDADRRGVQTWARLCMWRYFWDFLFEVSFNEKLKDIERWGRELPSVYERHLHIKRIAEHTLKKMEKKHRDKVFHQLAIFSDLQGPDIYWDEDLRVTGVDGLNADEIDSIDDMKTLTSRFGTLTIDLFKEPTFPIRGKWISANYTGDIDAMDDDNHESSDFVVLSLSKEGWDDLKLITQINSQPRIKKLRAARQKIRMLHGQPVSVLMKNCLRCTAPMVEGVSQCFVNGVLEFNGHLLAKAPEQIIDYVPTFSFKLRNINSTEIKRCGKRCQGNLPLSLTELDPDQFFIGSLLSRNGIPPQQVSSWEAALRRRRTCGLSFHFYSNVYANKEMPKEAVDAWRTAIQKCEGARSDIYQLIFEGSRPKLTKAVHELHRRMMAICSQPDRSYWFKFWVTACKALFPNSSAVPDDKWDFDFVNNQKAICYSVMERENLEELIKKSKIFDNASLYLSKNHSLEKVLDSLYANMNKMKLRINANDYNADVTEEQLNNPLSKGGVGGLSIAPSLGPADASGMMSPNAFPMSSGFSGMMSPGVMSPNAFPMSPGPAGLNRQSTMAYMNGFMSPMAQSFNDPYVFDRQASMVAMPPPQMPIGTSQVHATSLNTATPVFNGQSSILGGGNRLDLNNPPDVASAPMANSFGMPQNNNPMMGTSTIIVGNTAQNTEEYNQMAMQSQEVMGKLLAIQASVTEGTRTKEEARREMAALALQYPILLNAIGGGASVDVLKGGGTVTAPGHKRSNSDSRRLDDEDEEVLSFTPPSAGNSKKSKNNSGDEGRARNRRPIEPEDEVEEEDYYNNLTQTHMQQKQNEFQKLKMKESNIARRMCTSISDNGVDVPRKEEEKNPDEPDACTIM